MGAYKSPKIAQPTIYQKNKPTNSGLVSFK